MRMARYEEILQQQPASRDAGNTTEAIRFVAVLTHVLAHETATLNDSQKNYLYRLRQRWETRANGLDANWNAYGSRPGRRASGATKITRKENLDPTVFGDDDERDPLLSSLERKYGVPRRTDDI